jgi:hypothetical protein
MADAVWMMSAVHSIPKNLESASLPVSLQHPSVTLIESHASGLVRMLK